MYIYIYINLRERERAKQGSGWLLNDLVHVFLHGGRRRRGHVDDDVVESATCDDVGDL